MDEINLKPGTYTLRYNVLNPEADRRVKRDWRKKSEWKAGTTFIVEVDQIISDMIKENLARDGVDVSKLPEEAFVRCSLRPADGGFSHHAVYDRSLAYKLLAPNLEPAEETTEAMLSRLDIHRQYNDWKFFVFLCKKYGNAWFEAHWAEYYDQPEEA